MDVLREAFGSEELAHPAAIAGISFPELLFFHWHGMQGLAKKTSRSVIFLVLNLFHLLRTFLRQ